MTRRFAAQRSLQYVLAHSNDVCAKSPVEFTAFVLSQSTLMGRLM